MDAATLKEKVQPTQAVVLASTAAEAAVEAAQAVTDPNATTETKVAGAVAVGVSVVEKFAPPEVAALVELGATAEPLVYHLIQALLHLHKKHVDVVAENKQLKAATK